MEITKNQTPAQLAEIKSIKDIPVPDKIKHLLDRPAKLAEGDEKAGGGNDDDDEPAESIYSTLTRSLKETKLVTTITECEVDDEELLKKMEITKNQTPIQLAEIKSIKDIPVPDKIKHLLDRPAKQALVNGNAHEPAGDDECAKSGIMSMTEGFLETKLVTNIKECTDYDTLKKRQDLIKSKTPAELSAMSGIGDFPVPSKISNMLKKSDTGKDEASEPFHFENPLKNGLSVPESMKVALAVTTKVEDEEVVKRNQELLSSKSVSELGQINSMSDLPIPTAIENLMKKKFTSEHDIKASSLSLSNIASGKILPESLRETKLVTKVKVEKDQEKLLARQSIIKNQTPMELGSIKNMSDFPIPTRLQNLQHLQLPLFGGGPQARPVSAMGVPVEYYPTPPPRNKSCNASIYESLPSSLRNEVVVRSRTITDEESKARMEVIKSKTPAELSQISSLNEIPIPRTIEKLFENTNEGQEEKEYEDVSFVQKYSTLPPSMKTNLLVGVKTQDQEMVTQRAETVKSKSVVELSEIKSVSDFPLPSTLQRLAKREYAPVERKKLFKQQMKSHSTQSLSLQNTLPRSLRETQLLVASKVEDPELMQSRKSLAESKSIAELSKVSSLADFPVPGFFSKLASKSLSKLDFMSNGHLKEAGDEADAPKGIYATLPKSLNCELLVSRSVQDVSLLEERMQLVNERSTKDLARIGSLKDFPVPEAVKKFYHKSMDRLNGRVSGEDAADGLSAGKSMPSLKLPAMLSQPCIVKTKVEDPRVLLERQQIQQQKSIHELSKIRNLNEMPVPGNIITLPDVPLPKLRNMLQLVARTPPRKSQDKSLETPPPVGSERLDDMCHIDDEEDEYSNMDDSYEVITKEEERTESPQIEPFGLASQIKGTPERNTRSKKKKPEPKNRRSQEETKEEAVVVESPPPLPPKRSPQKSMSIESQQSLEVEGSPAPVKGVLTLEAMNGSLQVIKNEVHNAGGGIQSRPLPAPPAPVRYGKQQHQKEPAAAATPTEDRTLMEESQKFQTCRESLTTEQSRTLLVGSGAEDDDNTMADSIVESLVSCTDTLICDDEEDDDPYPSVNFEGGVSELQDLDPKAGGGKRLEEGTQQLSLELMEHVESLKHTLDNMSNRLGARSRSRSSSRPRSRPPSLYRQDK